MKTNKKVYQFGAFLLFLVILPYQNCFKMNASQKKLEEKSVFNSEMYYNKSEIILNEFSLDQQISYKPNFDGYKERLNCKNEEPNRTYEFLILKDVRTLSHYLKFEVKNKKTGELFVSEITPIVDQSTPELLNFIVYSKVEEKEDTIFQALIDPSFVENKTYISKTFVQLNFNSEYSEFIKVDFECVISN